jgi:hypothetical protein
MSVSRYTSFHNTWVGWALYSVRAIIGYEADKTVQMSSYNINDELYSCQVILRRYTIQYIM